MLERKAREFDVEKEKVESKLARLLDHRRRLLGILEASQVGEKRVIEFNRKEVNPSNVAV